MNSSIKKFLNSLSRIGASDDSIYDNLIKEEVLSLIIQQPDSRIFEPSESLTLSTEKSTLELKNAIAELLSDYELSRSKTSLKDKFEMFVSGLPVESAYRLKVEEFFGDYFDSPKENRKQLHVPLRNFFYSSKCYILFMLVPPLFVLSLAFWVYQNKLNGIVIVITVFIAVVSTLGGIMAHDYLNRKIQKYEGIPGAK